jgi:membrane protease YdiL (CAAX protease family)
MHMSIAAINIYLEQGLLWGGLALALAVAWRWKIWQGRLVVGPERCNAAEPPFHLLIVLGIGFGTWQLAGAAIFSALGIKAGLDAGTDPRMVWVGLFGPLAGMAALLGANLTLCPGGFSLLGVGFRRGRAGLVGAWWGTLFALPAVYAAGIVTVLLWDVLGFKHPDKHPLLEILSNSPGWALRLGTIAAAVVVAPLFEEMLFRGHLQTILRRMLTEGVLRGAEDQTSQQTRRVWLSIVLSAGAFALVHPDWTQPPIFVLALCLGYIYERTGSLWSAILVHMAFNAVQVALTLGGV